MLHWIKRCYRPASECSTLQDEPGLLALGALRFRMTDEVQEELTNLRVSGNKFTQMHCKNNKAEYESGKYTQVYKSRILLTHLVAEALAVFSINYKPTIIEAFRRIGLVSIAGRVRSIRSRSIISKAWRL